MNEKQSTGRELAGEAGKFLGYMAAVVAGLVLMIVGAGMGVSLVLLPFGIPIGLVGFFVFLWGLFGRLEENKAQLPGPR